ncbi:hypothetical protein I9W82_002492 [Candida metapsilosis]|uniref:Mannosyltransferase n=1 Tax=Candida metapsilosis TaxID=273372 RepID=A0A8H7ZIG3_9ASCO|nr:hypothetical protein I9W82_002492 [Candida metapsilosis]
MLRRIYIASLVLIAFSIYLSPSNQSADCYHYRNDAEFKSFLQAHHSEYQSENLSIVKSQVYNHRENATFLMLARNHDVYLVLETLQGIQDRFNDKFNYDYTFLNDEPFTSDFIYLISTYIPRGKVNFGIIPKEHWSYPSHINTTACAEVRANFADIPYGDSESYRHMCRFYSGFFYKHEMVRQYQYYWRIEPDVKLFCDVNEDLFRIMRENDKKYGYSIALFEYAETIPTLWPHVIKYIQERNLQPELLPMFTNKFGWYNLCHFWSNFEIANLDVFNNPQYEDFFNYLDLAGGFFYERWGDAPVHSMAMMIMLSKNDLHWFDQIGYTHPPYVQCPQDAAIYVKNRCVCNPDEDITLNDETSCNSHFLRFLEEV